MKTQIGVLAFLLLTVAGFAADDYSTWAAYKNITVDTRAQAGSANVATAQAGFPLLVRLNATNAADIFSGSQVANGGDIRFAAGSTHLSYQVERWDAAGSVAEFWVLVPTVKGNDTTQIQIYWGKAGAGDSASGAATFGAGNGYRAVWHFAETTSPSVDATASALNAVWQNNPATTAGMIGNAINLANGTGATGANGKFLTAANVSGGLNMKGSDGVTLSLWARRTGTNSGNTSVQMLAGRYNYSDLEMQFGLTTNASGALTLYYAPDGSADRTLASGVTLTSNTWYHITATLTSTTETIFVNGVQRATASVAMNSLDGVYADPFTIGVMDHTAPYSQYFNGALDEIQYSAKARPADWIKLTYQTQRTDSAFVTVGTTNLLPPANLTYAPNPAVYTVSYAIPANSPTVRGAVALYAVSPSLPAGLALNTSTGVITGTPTTAAASSGYTITATNPGGSTTAALTITVNASLVAPTALVYTSPTAVYGMGVAVAGNLPIITGTATTYSVNPALSPGLSLNTSTGVISGTPTAASAATTYTVTAGNSAGSITGTVNITVLAPPSALSYSTPNPSYPVNVAIAANSPTVTGTVSSYSIAPALSAGLTFNLSTGVISGTPTAVAAAKSYTITAANIAGTATATMNLTVFGPPSNLSYASAINAYTRGTAITPNNPTVTGVVTKYSVTPALPAGLKLDTITGIITGTPTDTTVGYVSHTVSASNAAGPTTATVLISVAKTPVAIAHLPTHAFALKVGSSKVSFRIPVGATGISFSIADTRGRGVWSKKLDASEMTRKAELVWNGAADNGRQVSAGLYIVRARINGAGRSATILEETIRYVP